MTTSFMNIVIIVTSLILSFFNLWRGCDPLVLITVDCIDV